MGISLYLPMIPDLNIRKCQFHLNFQQYLVYSPNYKNINIQQCYKNYRNKINNIFL